MLQWKFWRMLVWFFRDPIALEDWKNALDDLAMFHKLSHMLPAMHSSAHHIVEPYDHPISHRHLRITYSSMKYSDKTFMGMTTSPKNAEDVMDMCARHDAQAAVPNKAWNNMVRRYRTEGRRQQGKGMIGNGVSGGSMRQNSTCGAGLVIPGFRSSNICFEISTAGLEAV